MSTPSVSEAAFADVRELVGRYRDVFNAHDADQLAQLYAADIIFINQAGHVFTGRDAVRRQQDAGFAGSLGRTLLQVEVVDLVHLTRDDVAATLRQSARRDGVAAYATVTIVVSRGCGRRWVIRHFQATPVIEEGPP